MWRSLNPGQDESADWATLFEAAQLDRAVFASAEPGPAVSVLHDERVAWEGPSPDDARTRLRVEGARLVGAPVHFDVARVGVPSARPRQTFSRHTPAHELETLATIVLTNWLH